jgi:hypothetical protein
MVRRALTRPAALILILLMAAGSIAMWVVVPVAWLYLGSQMQKGSTPSLGPYVLVLAGIVVSMVVIGKLLGWMDRVYAILIGVSRQQRIQPPWHKSMRGERGSVRERTVLDSVMVVSVGLALVVFGVWFFAFAGSSLPT